MVIGQAQCFFIAVVIGAVIGTRRGWNREVITAAIIMATLLVLTLGGADALANWLSHGIVGTAQAHGIFASGGPQPQPTTPTGTGSPTASPSPLTSCSLAVNARMLSILIFTGMTWLAYAAGHKYGAPPKTANHRLLGAIPGAIDGASIAYFVSNTVLPGQSVQLNTPSAATTSSLLPLVFGLGLLGLLVVLFITAQANKGSK